MKPEKQLYQWDTNQSLVELTTSAQFVDYPIGDEVIRIKADGTRCRIPDEVLQTYGGKTCYERYPDGTYRAYSFTVLYAPKPPDYVFTPEERTTFEALTARVDAAIEEIKRRADSGEFTPVKGVDYYTKEEQAELITAVSSGAESEFRKVTEEETAKFEATAESKLTDYNRNAAEKLEAYNQNAENKTAEFDANAAALQTEVDRLRRECDTLAAENRKQENRIDALIKLNNGQTYDILPEEGESASRTAPSGAKYVSVDMVGGKSVVWNQLVHSEATGFGGTLDVDSGVYTLTPNISSGFSEVRFQNNTPYTRKNGHKYYVSTEVKSDAWARGENTAFCVYDNLWLKVYMTKVDTSNHSWQKLKCIFESKEDASSNSYFNFRKYHEETNSPVSIKNAMVFDLTQMFGAGNEPSTVEEFEAMFPADYYPYSEPTIISSQTDRVDVASADSTVTQQITTGFPVLNSAGSVYDYIDLNEGKLHRRVGVVDLGTLNWRYSEPDGWHQVVFKNRGRNNLLCDRYKTDKYVLLNNKTIGCNSSYLVVVDTSYTDGNALKQALQGVMLYYELAEEVITDITIPTELTYWLTVEAGGSVTFHDADESKQLAVPNAVSWVRKLNEVE